MRSFYLQGNPTPEQRIFDLEADINLAKPLIDTVIHCLSTHNNSQPHTCCLERLRKIQQVLSNYTK